MKSTNYLLINLLIYLLLACWASDPKKRPEMSKVIKLLDTVDINDTIQHVENISENNSLNNIKNSHEQMEDLSSFEITSEMEKRFLNNK